MRGDGRDEPRYALTADDRAARGTNHPTSVQVRNDVRSEQTLQLGSVTFSSRVSQGVEKAPLPCRADGGAVSFREVLACPRDQLPTIDLVGSEDLRDLC